MTSTRMRWPGRNVMPGPAVGMNVHEPRHEVRVRRRRRGEQRHRHRPERRGRGPPRAAPSRRAAPPGRRRAGGPAGPGRSDRGPRSSATPARVHRRASGRRRATRARPTPSARARPARAAARARPATASPRRTTCPSCRRRTSRTQAVRAHWTESCRRHACAITPVGGARQPVPHGGLDVVGDHQLRCGSIVSGRGHRLPPATASAGVTAGRPCRPPSSSVPPPASRPAAIAGAKPGKICPS